MKRLHCTLVVVVVTSVAFTYSNVLAQLIEETIRVPESRYTMPEKPRAEKELKTDKDRLAAALESYKTSRDWKNEVQTYYRLGRVYEGLLEFDKAECCYDKAMALATKYADIGGVAQGSSCFGWLRWKFGNYAEATELYNQTLEVTKTMDDAKGEARALYALGLLHDHNLNRDEKADEYFEKALSLSTKIADMPGIAQAAFTLGWRYRIRSEVDKTQIDKALKLLKAALEATRKQGDRLGEARALDFIAEVHELSGQYQKTESATSGYAEAMEFRKNALAVYATLGNGSYTTTATSNLAELYLKLGLRKEALALYQEAVESAKKTGNLKLEAEAQESLGYAYQDQAQYHKALEAYAKLLVLRKRIGDPVTTYRAMKNIARVYALLGESDKTELLYHKALEAAQKAGHHSQEEWFLASLAAIYVRRGQPDKVLAPFEKALETARRTGDAKGEAHALDSLGYICDKQQRYDKAAEFYTMSLTARTRIGDLAGGFHTLLNLGDLYRSQPQHKSKALESYKKALENAKRLNNLKLQAQALDNIGYMYKEDTYDEAVRSYQEALAIWIRIGDRQSEGSTRSHLRGVYPKQENSKTLAIQEKHLKGARDKHDRRGEAQALAEIAMYHRVRRHQPASLEYYNRALAIWTALNDPVGRAACLHGLGLVYLDSGQYDKAYHSLSQVIPLAQETNDLRLLKKLMQSFDGLAIRQREKGRNEQAVKTNAKEIEIAHELKDAHMEARSYGASGRLYREMHQYYKARESFENQLKLAEKSEHGFHNFQELIALSGLSDVLCDLGDYEKAVEFGERALTLCRSIPDFRSKNREKEALDRLGAIYYARGQFAKAVEFYEKGLQIYRNQDTDLFIALALTHEGDAMNNLGRIYKTWGRYDKAVELYHESLRIHRAKHQKTQEGNALEDLGSLYRSWGQYDKSVELLKQSADVRKRAGDIKAAAASLMALAEVLERTEDSPQVLGVYEKILETYSRIGLPTDRPKDRIGNLYLAIGDIAKAEPYLREAGHLSSLGRLSLAKSEYENAKTLYQRILDSAQTSKDADDLFTAYTGLGLASEGLGQDQAAQEYFRKAVDLVEELRMRVTPENRVLFLDAQVNGFRRTAPYEGLARVLIRLNQPGEAWITSEYTKARAFAESMSVRSGGPGFDVPKNVLQADEDLNNRLSALKRRRQTAYEKDDRQILESLDSKINDLDNEFKKHLSMLREHYPIFAGSKYPEPMALSETALKAEEWVLSYDVTDPGLIVYLSQGKTLKQALFTPIARKDLDLLVRKFREPLDIKPGENVRTKIAQFDFASGRQLAKILLQDVLPSVPEGAPLIVVPADCLGALPFEMLVLNDGGQIVDENGIPNATGAEFFGDRNPISYYQSVTALTLVRHFEKRKGFGNRLLVMCDPVFSENDPRAKEVADNREQPPMNRRTLDLMASANAQHGLTWQRMTLTGKLGRHLSHSYPESTDVYEGLQATKATFKELDLSKYQAIVFGTHGYAGTDLGGLKEPVLVLTLINQPEGQDGFLRQSEVMGLKMNCDLVVLTACQSGLGKRISGEGTMGMGRAFQYAGAKSVLMSLWSVDQNSSVQLTESFLKHLKEGRSEIDAIRLARGEIRKKGYDHPFFWASFILMGEAD